MKENKEYLLKRLNYAKRRSKKFKKNMENNNINRFGGWQSGYFDGMVATLEGVLDEFYKGWDD